MRRKPLTNKTRIELLNLTERNLEDYARLTDKLNELLGKIEEIKFKLKDLKINVGLENYVNLINYRLLLNFLILDLSVNIKAYLNASLEYEGIYFVRQMIVIMSEGYKKIYNFTRMDEKGNIITIYRNNSFWVKEVKKIVNEDLPHLRVDYDQITKKLENLLEIGLEDFKEYRDLSIHYDKNPNKFYEMLLAIDSEEHFKKISIYLNILFDMSEFTDKVGKNYLAKTEKSKKELNQRIEDFLDILENKKNDANEIEISKFQKWLMQIYWSEK